MRLFAWALSVGLTSVGCGGSSSETPPPLEPDPTSYRYTGPRVSSANDPRPSDAEPIAPEPSEEAAPRAAGKPASATWGSGKTPPAPAPSVNEPKP